jgi:hypothetical protein
MITAATNPNRRALRSCIRRARNVDILTEGFWPRAIYEWLPEVALPGNNLVEFRMNVSSDAT